MARTRSRRRPAIDDGRALYQVASLLLQYPDAELVERLPLLRQVAGAQPRTASAGLARVLDVLETEPLSNLQMDYVETFDLRRRACLYLTYYAHGDTRNRGMALLNFKSAYRRAGVVLDESELPDYLPVVLEFAATADLDEGRRLLIENRAGLELLSLSLTDLSSPYTGVIAAVSSTLPTVRGDQREVIAKLIAQGPPDEAVGLDPFSSVDLTVGGRL